MAENTNIYAPFKNRDEWLKSFFGSYSDLHPELAEGLTPDEKAAGAIQDAKSRLKRGWIKTALIGAGLVIGTALTGGLLAAGLGVVGAAVGVGVAGISLGSGVSNWRMITSLFGGRNDPQIAEARLVKGLANHYTIVQSLESRLQNETSPQARRDLLFQLKKASNRLNNFTLKQNAKIQKSKTALYAHGGSRKRDGFWGQIDRARQWGQNVSVEYLGTLRWVNKQYKAENRYNALTDNVSKVLNDVQIINARHNLGINNKNNKFMGRVEEAFKEDFKTAKKAGHQVGQSKKFENTINNAQSVRDFRVEYDKVQAGVSTYIPLSVVIKAKSDGYNLSEDEQSEYTKSAARAISTGDFSRLSYNDRKLFYDEYFNEKSMFNFEVKDRLKKIEPKLTATQTTLVETFNKGATQEKRDRTARAKAEATAQQKRETAQKNAQNAQEQTP